jgi:hypothetical protein
LTYYDGVEYELKIDPATSKMAAFKGPRVVVIQLSKQTNP